jgi:uncharacterized RDD family membrane protein YckC
MQSSTAASTRDAYGGFWRRFAAYAIDYLLAILLSVALALAAILTGFDDERTEALISIVVVVGYFLYYTLLESSSSQATIGKRAMGLKVTNRDGEPIGFGRATARFFAKFLSVFTLCLGYLLIVVTKRRQALHDLLAGTLVVHTHVPPRVSGPVVALVAAAASLPLLGILGAIAIPAYRDYTIRAQVTEGLALAGAFRTAVETAWRDSPRDLSSSTSDAIGAGLASSGRYVESVELVSGMIVITYGAAADDAIAGSVLTLVPALDGQRNLHWACGYGPAPPGFEVAFESHEGYTDIPERYIPSGCRRPVSTPPRSPAGQPAP